MCQIWYTGRVIDQDPIFTTFLKKEQITFDAWTFYFRKPVGFRYAAGQYIKIKLPIKTPDNRGNSRYFTLSSSPTEEFLKITTRILKSSFKTALSELSENTDVEMRGPWGDFVLDEADNRERIFLAGGIGLTPFHSMIKYVTDMNLNIKIKMIVSYKTETEILFMKELDEIQKNNKDIEIIVTISEPGEYWKGEVGRISTQLLQKKLASLEGNVYYMSGPEKMVASLEKSLVSVGILKGDILTDEFPGYI